MAFTWDHGQVNVQGTINAFFANNITAAGLPACLTGVGILYDFPTQSLTGFPTYSLYHLESFTTPIAQGGIVSTPEYYAATVKTHTPVAYWRFGESSGTTAADSSGNGNHATYNGTFTYGVTGALSNDDDTAVTLDGTTAYATASDLGLGGLSALTLECWVKLSAGASEKYVLWRNGQADLRIGTSSIAFSLRTSSGFTVFRVNTSVSANTWHHVVAVYDGSYMYIYLDNNLLQSQEKTGTINNGSGNFEIGSVNTAPSFAGSLDEVVVYETALTARDVAWHYRVATNPATLRTGQRVDGILEVDCWNTVRLSNGYHNNSAIIQLRAMRDLVHYIFTSAKSVTIKDVYSSTASPPSISALIRFGNISDSEVLIDPNPDIRRIRILVDYTYIERK